MHICRGTGWFIRLPCGLLQPAVPCACILHAGVLVLPLHCVCSGGMCTCCELPGFKLCGGTWK